MEVLLAGRPTACTPSVLLVGLACSPRDSGRAYESVLEAGRSALEAGLAYTEADILVLLAGRKEAVSDLSLASLRVGRGPKDNRLMPDVDKRETCFTPEGVSSEPEVTALDMVLARSDRFLLRMVTLDGMAFPEPGPALRGDARGGV